MITVYSKPGCVHCDGAKAWLKQNQIDYSEIDISENSEAKDFVVANGHRSVPQLYIGKKLLVEGGFSGLRAMSPETIRNMIQN